MKSPPNFYPRRAFLGAEKSAYSGLMFAACRPFGPRFTSNSTFWPSFSVLKPLIWIAVGCANRSSPPSVGVMKPKPLESLNHLTVPVAIYFFLLLEAATNPGATKPGTTIKGTDGHYGRRFWRRERGTNSLLDILRAG